MLKLFAQLCLLLARLFDFDFCIFDVWVRNKHVYCAVQDDEELVARASPVEHVLVRLLELVVQTRHDLYKVLVLDVTVLEKLDLFN